MTFLLQLSPDSPFISGNSPIYIDRVTDRSIHIEFDGFNTNGISSFKVLCNVLVTPNTYTPEATYGITFTYYDRTTASDVSVESTIDIQLHAEPPALDLAVASTLKSETSSLDLTLDQIDLDMKAPYALLVSFTNANVTYHNPEDLSGCNVNGSPTVPIITNSTTIIFQAPKTVALQGTTLNLSCKGPLKIIPFNPENIEEEKRDVLALDAIVQYNLLHESRFTASYKYVEPDVSFSNPISVTNSLLAVFAAIVLFV